MTISFFAQQQGFSPPPQNISESVVVRTGKVGRPRKLVKKERVKSGKKPGRPATSLNPRVKTGRKPGRPRKNAEPITSPYEEYSGILDNININTPRSNSSSSMSESSSRSLKKNDNKNTVYDGIFKNRNFEELEKRNLEEEEIKYNELDKNFLMSISSSRKMLYDNLTTSPVDPPRAISENDSKKIANDENKSENENSKKSNRSTSSQFESPYNSEEEKSCSSNRQQYSSNSFLNSQQNSSQIEQDNVSEEASNHEQNSIETKQEVSEEESTEVGGCDYTKPLLRGPGYWDRLRNGGRGMRITGTKEEVWMGLAYRTYGGRKTRDALCLDENNQVVFRSRLKQKQNQRGAKRGPYTKKQK